MNANINYDEIPDTSAVQEDLLAALSSQHVTVHTNEEPDFDYMENEDVAFVVKNPHNEENLLIELGGEFSVFFGLWHGQYKAVEYDYDRMKKDIAAILAGNAGVLSLYTDIIGILLGYSKQMIHNTPMWFFICLYFLEIFYYLLFKPLQKKSKSIKISVLIVIAVIGYTNYAYNPYTLPFCLGTAIVGMVFYGIGNLIVHNIQIIKIKLLHIILVFLTMGIVIFIAHENGYIIMATNNYNNYILFFIGSFAGICMINLSSNFLSLKPVFQNIIIYISKNTLIINSFHLLTFSFLKGIMVFVFHIPVETLYGKIVPNIVFALVSLFSCLPIAYIINKHFPFIIGKKRSPEG